MYMGGYVDDGRQESGVLAIGMVAARLAMNDWGKKYEQVLIDSLVPPDLLTYSTDERKFVM